MEPSKNPLYPGAMDPWSPEGCTNTTTFALQEMLLHLKIHSILEQWSHGALKGAPTPPLLLYKRPNAILSLPKKLRTLRLPKFTQIYPNSIDFAIALLVSPAVWLGTADWVVLGGIVTFHI